jgi:hypothetical protein
MSKFSTCLATSPLPGGKTACECWGDFKNVAVSSGCIIEQYSAICLQASVLCASATDCAFGIPATTCAQAFTQKALCLVTAGIDTAKLCSCYKNFESAASTLCPAGDWMGNCSLTNSLCGQDTCKFDCNLLNSYIPDCTSQFESCTDKCQCYQQFPVCILNSVDFCDLAKIALLKACVETQLTCVTFASQCDSTDVSIGITEVAALFTKYKTQLIAKWNKTLELAGTIVEDCIQLATETKVTFTVTISWDDTVTNIAQVIANIETEFVKTLGVQASQLTAYQKVAQPQTAAGKKRASTRDEIIVEVASTQTSGTSMITVFIAPIIIFNGLLLWFFNH